MMKPRIALFCALLSAALFAAPKPEWQIRPWEILQGLKPKGVQLWRLDKDGLEGWKVSGCGATLDTTDLTKLWGEKVARVTFTKEGALLTVTAARPIAIPDDADGLEIWLFGPVNKGFGSKPRISVLVTDANGKSHRISATGCGSRWAQKRWWGTAAAIFPKELKRPLTLKSFALNKVIIGDKPDFFCFDQINAFRFKKVEIPDTRKMDLGFPTTPDTILPASAAPGSRNDLRQDGNAWIFTYEGKDAKVTYRYAPKDGTLGDITASINGGNTFQPARNGGPRAKVAGVAFIPGDAAIAPILHSCRLVDGKVVADWNWTRDGQSLDFTYRLSIKGKSLVVEADSAQLDVTAFDAGVATGLASPRLFGCTYLHNRWDYPRFLATPEFILSVFCDWYTTHAAECVEGVGRCGLPGAAVLDATSARLMGGNAYVPKTDGKLNPLHERFIITVSTELADTLPSIPNPVSKYRGEMARLVCHTRHYSLQGSPRHVDQELAFWKKMRRYGLTDLFIRYHAGQFRTPLENNRTTLSLDGSRSNGGDEVMVKLVTGLRDIYPRIGVYQDNRIIHPNDPLFDYSLVSIRGERFLEGWDGCYRPKPASMLKIYQDFLPKFLAKYPYNAEYLDELTNAPPWGDVDYDAAAPGAATYSQVLRDFGAVAILSRKLFNGPVWSEGCAAYFWAGLLDVDYACSNDTRAGLPLIVDFKLRKILPLETYTGADWPVFRGTDVDLLIATEIAEANIGHLARFPHYGQGLVARAKPELLDRFLKTYYMMRQVQEQFCASPVAEIKYLVDGKMMTASEMLRAGKTSQNRIYARYENGLETWVNRAPGGDWTIEVDGKEVVLPPAGHYARRPDHLLQYSILVDGRRVDYSRGHLFTYVNGGGVPFEFPELTAAGPYLLRRRGDATLLTPAPFHKPERIARLDARTATPCAPDEKPCAAPAPITALSIDGKAFHYLLK